MTFGNHERELTCHSQNRTWDLCRGAHPFPAWAVRHFHKEGNSWMSWTRMLLMSPPHGELDSEVPGVLGLPSRQHGFVWFWFYLPRLSINSHCFLYEGSADIYPSSLQCRVKGFIARNDLAWRITWAAFSHRRRRPERSGGLSKITGLLRGPLETRTEFSWVLILLLMLLGQLHTALLAFSFPLWGFCFDSWRDLPRWGFLFFFSPNLLSIYFYLIAKFDFNFIYRFVLFKTYCIE